jgi:16S rRNA G966 N2-methylase RsmD
MEAVKAFDILSKGGIMVCETMRDAVLPDLGEDFGTVRTYRYGKIKLTVVTRGN